MATDSKKSANVDYFRVPRPLWRFIKRELPPDPKPPPGQPGRQRIANRAVLNGLWYLLWTGCQWKAIKREWFGVSKSVLNERLHTWQQQGIWAKVMTRVARFYHRQRRIQWTWQAVDSKSCPAPLGGPSTGPNPTDRAKRGSKIHLLVDQRGAPLGVYVTGANDHDKWSLDDVVIAVVLPRPSRPQNLCADKAYDSEDIRTWAPTAGYIAHIPHRRRRGEAVEVVVIPKDQLHPAKRWVVERTLAWLTKRRSLRTRWFKKAEGWLAFIQFACAHILCNLALAEAN